MERSPGEGMLKVFLHQFLPVGAFEGPLASVVPSLTRADRVSEGAAAARKNSIPQFSSDAGTSWAASGSPSAAADTDGSGSSPPSSSSASSNPSSSSSSASKSKVIERTVVPRSSVFLSAALLDCVKDGYELMKRAQYADVISMMTEGNQLDISFFTR